MKKGFTLAEVLITLAVIGVVATLTMPNLIGNYKNRVLMTQLQKTINTVTNSVSRAMNDYAAEKFGDVVTNPDTAKSFLKDYFDTVNICTRDSGYSNCLAASYNNIDWNTPTGSIFPTAGGMPFVCGNLTSGATVCIASEDNNGHGGAMGFGGIVFVITDVNGLQGPNINGKDLFWFAVLNNGKLWYSAEKPNSPDEEKMQAEAAGEKCSIEYYYPLQNTCLPYIISHGWEFKF